MANGVNRVILVGRLGADPELRNTQSGQTVCTMNLATSESWKDKAHQKQERTEWHRCVAWGKLAEVCAKYLKKGSQAYVEGKLTTKKWEDNQGVQRYTTEVIASDVQFLGGGSRDGERQQSRRDDGAGYGDAEGYGDASPNYGSATGGDDIPF